MVKIAIVGGGIAGSTAALYLGKLGLDVTLFEKKPSLISGPPFCHLHAGGNLYREIPDEECITLLNQSIDLLKFYPYAVDYRPTVIAIPNEDKSNPEDLLPRLRLLQKQYQDLIDQDILNKVLGESCEYFKLYDKDKLEELKNLNSVDMPQTLDEWMIPVAKNVDFSKIKLPLIMVQEYGLNLFSMAAGIEILLKDIQNCDLKVNTKVQSVKSCDDGYVVDGEKFDYLINSAGFKTGSIDDMLGFKRDRLVEFKAAYVTKWDACDSVWPEIIFHGTRGTPQGMGQFTPYPDGHFQLHGMTKDITLFDDGLVKNKDKSSQPKLDDRFITKIETNWDPKDVEKRTKLAIKHLCNFIPSFCGSKVASKPLYGAQQIPGTNKDLRAADVSFEGDRYARCEVVKASSVLSMCDQILSKLVSLGYVDSNQKGKRDFEGIYLSSEDIKEYSQKISQSRGYPRSIGARNVETPQDK